MLEKANVTNQYQQYHQYHQKVTVDTNLPPSIPEITSRPRNARVQEGGIVEVKKIFIKLLETSSSTVYTWIVEVIKMFFEIKAENEF